MDTQNTQNIASPLFTLALPFNNNIFLTSRKKSGKKVGILMICAGVLFLIFTIASALSGAGVGVVLIFGGFLLMCLITAIYFFCQGKYNPKNDNLAYMFVFLQDGLQISKNSKKNIEQFYIETACLYRPYDNKQYINKVVETLESFTFSVYTGTYNFVPQYKEYVLPKNVFTSGEQLQSFINFLKTIFTIDYTTKIDM